jgi:hypothetical protein
MGALTPSASLLATLVSDHVARVAFDQRRQNGSLGSPDEVAPSNDLERLLAPSLTLYLRSKTGVCCACRLRHARKGGRWPAAAPRRQRTQRVGVAVNGASLAVHQHVEPSSSDGGTKQLVKRSKSSSPTANSRSPLASFHLQSGFTMRIAEQDALARIGAVEIRSTKDA